MKRVLKEVIVASPARLTPFARQLVVKHGLTQGPLFDRWQFAVKMMQVCRSLRHSPLVKYAASEYCVKFEVSVKFEKFIHPDKEGICEAFPQIRHQYVGAHYWMDEIDAFQHMQNEWRASLFLDNDPYVAGPGFKTTSLITSSLGLSFRNVQDMGFHVKGGKGAMDKYMAWKASSTLAGLAFMYTMITQFPNQPFFIIFPIYFYCYVDKDLQVTFFSTVKRVSGNPHAWDTGIASAVSILLDNDYHRRGDSQDRQIACFKQAWAKEGTSTEKLGYLLTTWYRQLFEIDQFEVK
jgi:hypothetical protein